MKITASFPLLVGTFAALLLMLMPSIASAQPALNAPTDLTATPGVNMVRLEWTPPPDAEYHFVAWLPAGANPVDASIRPVDATGQAAITDLLPGRTYYFTVIAGRWEWASSQFGPKWSDWTPWADAIPLAPMAKISLSSAEYRRGYQLAVSGTGFNNGSLAAVHVLHTVDPYPAWWNSATCPERNDIVAQSISNPDAAGNDYCHSWSRLNAKQQAKVRSVSLLDGGPAEATFCRHIIREGHHAASDRVGSNGRVRIDNVTVTVPVFGPGNTNYICVIDSEGRSSDTDVEQFNLIPSISVTPNWVGGEYRGQVTVHAQDYPVPGQSLTLVKIANQVVWPRGAVDRRYPGNYVSSLVPANIGPDGSATITFNMPSRISNVHLSPGQFPIEAQWGDLSAATRFSIGLPSPP